jgi:hypothetical protein
MDRDSKIVAWTTAIFVSAVIGVPILAIALGDVNLTWSERLRGASKTFREAWHLVQDVLFYIFSIAFFIVGSLLIWLWPVGGATKNTSDNTERNSPSAMTDAPKVLQLRPNFYGIGIDLIELWKWVKKRLR